MNSAIRILMIMGLWISLSGCQSIFVEPTATPAPTATNTVTPSPTPTPTATPNPAVENGLPLVARVNGHPIYQHDYESVLTWAKQPAEMVLEQIINDYVVLLIAQQKNITVTASEIETVIEANQPPEAQFSLWLKRNRLTESTLKAKLRQELLREKLLTTTGGNPTDFNDWLTEQRSFMSIEQYNIK